MDVHYTIPRFQEIYHLIHVCMPSTRVSVRAASVTVPWMRKGWLQHFLSSIMTLSRLGTVVVVEEPFERKVKFFSRMAR